MLGWRFGVYVGPAVRKFRVQIPSMVKRCVVVYGILWCI